MLHDDGVNVFHHAAATKPVLTCHAPTVRLLAPHPLTCEDVGGHSLVLDASLVYLLVGQFKSLKHYSSENYSLLWQLHYCLVPLVGSIRQR